MPQPEPSSTIGLRLERVRAHVAAAAGRAGRDPGGVTLLGATKGVAPEEIRAAWAAGLADVGENRAQELRDKQAALADLPLRWHFIGRLQTNKVRTVVGRVALIHSLDRRELAEAIDRRATRLGVRQDCLVQVNAAGEPTKAGVSPEDLPRFLGEVARLSGLRVVGLMTIAPAGEHAEAARPFFRTLRRLAEELRREAIPGVELRHLSMGMSGDYEVAVEEGATLVRIGTAIFGSRPVEAG